MPSSLAFESPFLQFHTPAKYRKTHTPTNVSSPGLVPVDSIRDTRHPPLPPQATNIARAQTTVAHNISRLYQGLTLAVHCHSLYSTPAYRYPARISKCSRSDRHTLTHARTHSRIRHPRTPPRALQDMAREPGYFKMLAAVLSSTWPREGCCHCQVEVLAIAL